MCVTHVQHYNNTFPVPVTFYYKAQQQNKVVDVVHTSSYIVLVGVTQLFHFSYYASC